MERQEDSVGYGEEDECDIEKNQKKGTNELPSIQTPEL